MYIYIYIYIYIKYKEMKSSGREVDKKKCFLYFKT